VWRSPVARFVRDEEVVGSNPITPTMSEFFTLYILKSCKKNRYYVGHTNDLERRINEHNSGQTKSTKPYLPWKIVFRKEYENKSDAYFAEMFIKKKKSRSFIEKLISGELDS
jgi:putative endonuclease